MVTTLETIGDKLARGLALDRADAEALWQSRDLIRLGMLADGCRRRRHGAITTFVRVADVEVTSLAEATLPPTAGEVRLQGTAGAIDASLAVIERFTARCPGRVVTGGLLEDVVSATGPRLGDWLTRAREAGVWGLSSAAVDRLPDPVAAVAAVREAGLEIARFVTSSPDPEGPWRVLGRIADVQRVTGAVRAFAPLPRAHDAARPTTGFADMKVVALARLVLDGVPSIQVDWTLHGPKLAQVALLFGADDLDAVSPAEEGEAGRRRSPLQEMLGNIKAASLEARERDGRFAVRAADAADRSTGRSW